MTDDPKRCSGCGEPHPRTLAYWLPSNYGDGFRAMCRGCTNARARAQRKKASPRVSRAKTKAKARPEIAYRVVEDKYGQRRALMYWQEPKQGERVIGVGRKFLNL